MSSRTSQCTIPSSPHPVRSACSSSSTLCAMARNTGKSIPTPSVYWAGVMVPQVGIGGGNAGTASPIAVGSIARCAVASACAIATASSTARLAAPCRRVRSVSWAVSASVTSSATVPSRAGAASRSSGTQPAASEAPSTRSMAASRASSGSEVPAACLQNTVRSSARVTSAATRRESSGTIRRTRWLLGQRGTGERVHQWGMVLHTDNPQARPRYTARGTTRGEPMETQLPAAPA